MSTPPVIKDQYTDFRTDQMQAPAGGLQIKSLKNRTDESNYSDYSFVILQDAYGALLRFFNGNAIISSTADFTITSMGNFTLSIKGGKQEVVSGNSHLYIEGDSSEMIGSQTDADKGAIDGIYGMVKGIQQTRLSAIKSASGKQMPCPICNSQILKELEDGRIQQATNFLKNRINPWNDGPYETVRKLTSYMISPLYEKISTIDARGGKSCSNPGCKGGFIEDLSADLYKDVASGGGGGGGSLEEYLCGGGGGGGGGGNTSGAVKAQSGPIHAAEQKLGIGGHKSIISKGDVLLKSGLRKNDVDGYVTRGTHNLTLYFEPGEGKNRQYLVPGGRGNCPKVHRVNAPAMIGNLTLDVANKLTINAGTPGIDITTGGHISLEGGSTYVIANRGEMMIGSNNMTILKGKNVLIDADDNTGDSGLHVNSRTTMIAGAFNVAGDSAFKGHITTDGGLSTPYIVAPSMRLETEVAGSSRISTGGTMWEEEEKIIEENSFIKDLYRKYNAPWSLMTHDSLINFILELYEYEMNDILNEVFVSGWAYTGGIWSKSTIQVINPETEEKEYIYSETLPAWSPVYNYKHKHIQYGESHTHTYTAIKGSYYQNNESWGSERGSGNNSVPAPTPLTGDGPAPGGKSKGSGSDSGNQYAGKIGERNDAFGAEGVFGGSNFVQSSEGVENSVFSALKD